MRDVIIACDFKDKESLFKFLVPFKGLNPFLKIGMEIFYKEGPSLVRELKQMGCRIFLDLKLYDIPHTVENAMKNISSLGVDITDCHAQGGIEMMKAARRGLDATEQGKKTKLIAVTVLTSFTKEVLNNEISINGEVNDIVDKYAKNAKEAGLDGCVCSPLEAKIIKSNDLIAVTPGIRFASDSKNDQKRVATPEYAKELGADYIVVGRSITASDDPVSSYKRCLKEFC